jgi:hypothetical protein
MGDQNLTQAGGLVDTNAAARLLGVSPRCLQNWRTRGGGPKYKKLGRGVRYAPADLDDFLHERTRRTTS